MNYPMSSAIAYTVAAVSLAVAVTAFAASSLVLMVSAYLRRKEFFPPKALISLAYAIVLAAPVANMLHLAHIDAVVAAKGSFSRGAVFLQHALNAFRVPYGRAIAEAVVAHSGETVAVALGFIVCVSGVAIAWGFLRHSRWSWYVLAALSCWLLVRVPFGLGALLSVAPAPPEYRFVVSYRSFLVCADLIKIAFLAALVVMLRTRPMREVFCVDGYRQGDSTGDANARGTV